MRRLAPAVALLAVLAGCGDDPVSSGAPPSTTEVPATTAAPTTTTTTEVPAAPAGVDAVVPPGGTLEVLVLGDSVMHDAAPGIAAALEATGQATVREATVFGLGFSAQAAVPFSEGADELLAGPPVEQVVVMVGSWDQMGARRDPAEFADAVRSGLERLAADGREVLVLGEPPSDPSKGEEGIRALVNLVLQVQADAVEGARYAPTSVIIGDALGRYQLRDASGRLLRKPDGRHLCPDGAVRFGRGVLDLLRDDWVLAAPGTAWEVGDWRAEGRYDDPPGSCEG